MGSKPKALGICGSARRGGNTDLLIEEVLLGASQAGLETEKVYLDELKIGPCRGCVSCKDNDFGCIISDDFRELIQKIEGAGLIVIGSPVYMAQVTGQAKVMLDRLYSLRRRDRSIRIDGSAKKGVIIVTCGATEPEHPEPTKKTLGILFRFLNTPDVASIVEQGLGTRGAVRERPQALARARKTGETLGKTLMEGVAAKCRQ